VVLEAAPGPGAVLHASNSCCLLNSSESLLSHVEQLLRAFILKISVCDAVLDNNPPGKHVPTA